jgi:hypothetical protein
MKNFDNFNNVKEVPIPQFFDGGRIMILTKEGDVKSIVWNEKDKTWRLTENRQVQFNIKLVKQWALFPGKNSEKWIVPTPPKAPDPKEVKAEKDSIAAIKKYIDDFNAEWMPFIKQQNKDKAAMERKLKAKAKALKGTTIVKYFKEFITDIDTDSDFYYEYLELHDYIDVFEYLNDGTPLKYEDFKEYYTNVNEEIDD